MWERECAGGFGIVVAHDCEIPAFAGMVYLCTGNCWRILAIVLATIGRWFGGDNLLADFGDSLAAATKTDAAWALLVKICTIF